MKVFALALLVSAFALGSMNGPASAQTYRECEAKAVSKTKGTPLAVPNWHRTRRGRSSSTAIPITPFI
jgi:hypothetical protein